MFLPNGHVVNRDPVHEPPVTIIDFNVVTAHLSLPHPTIGIKRPVFEAIAAFPLQAIIGVTILVPELYGDLVVLPREEFLAKSIVAFSSPFLLEKGYDLVVAADEAVPVTPDAVLGVCFDDRVRVSVHATPTDQRQRL